MKQCYAAVTEGEKVGRAVLCPPRRARSARPTSQDRRITKQLQPDSNHFECGRCGLDTNKPALKSSNASMFILPTQSGVSRKKFRDNKNASE